MLDLIFRKKIISMKNVSMCSLAMQLSNTPNYFLVFGMTTDRWMVL